MWFFFAGRDGRTAAAGPRVAALPAAAEGGAAPADRGPRGGPPAAAPADPAADRPVQVRDRPAHQGLQRFKDGSTSSLLFLSVPFLFSFVCRFTRPSSVFCWCPPPFRHHFFFSKVAVDSWPGGGRDPTEKGPLSCFKKNFTGCYYFWF